MTRGENRAAAGTRPASGAARRIEAGEAPRADATYVRALVFATSDAFAEALARHGLRVPGLEMRIKLMAGGGERFVSAATALARTYDVSAPRVHANARRRGGQIAVGVRGSKDRTERGHELAGRVSYGLLVSRDGGRDFSTVVRQRRRPFRRSIRIRGARANVVVAAVCDGNGNCGVKRLGRFSAF